MDYRDLYGDSIERVALLPWVYLYFWVFSHPFLLLFFGWISSLLKYLWCVSHSDPSDLNGV